jgi:digalactosyldiacylglycerol synthase
MGNSATKYSKDASFLEQSHDGKPASSIDSPSSMISQEKRNCNSKRDNKARETSFGCGDRFLRSPFQKRPSVYLEFYDNESADFDDKSIANLQTSTSSSLDYSEERSDFSSRRSEGEYLKISSPPTAVPEKEIVSCSWFSSSSSGQYTQQFEYVHDDDDDNNNNNDGNTMSSASSCLALMSILVSNSQTQNLIIDSIEDIASDSNTKVQRSSLENMLGKLPAEERKRSRRTRSWLSFPSYPSSLDLLELSDTNPIPSSIISNDKEMWIITTAALPWFTGTAVNPLLRAAYLARNRLKSRNRCQGEEVAPSHVGAVNLVIPWLELDTDRVALYGSDWVDKTQSDQTRYIIDWLEVEFLDALDENETDTTTNESFGKLINIHFYSARYHTDLGSIFPMGGICNKLPVQDRDNAICILEEPEHLNYYLAPSSISWRQRFSHVVGVIHTNYPYYAAHKSSTKVNAGSIRNDTMISGSKSTSSLLATSVEMFSAWMVQAYCDKVIKLSSALPVYASTKEVVSAIHGIRNEFLKVGRLGLSDPGTRNEVYFLGKLLWAKGLDKLLELQECHKQQLGYYFPVDIYGSGSDQNEIEFAFGKNQHNRIPADFKGRIDHVMVGTHYSVFVNPSESEVLCTSTAEAIAMGKYAIIPNHPSNLFFAQFPNCLTYNSTDEFIQKLQLALASSPQPLSSELQRLLTWEAATERLIEASYVSEQAAYTRQQTGVLQQEHRLASLHRLLGSGRTGDLLRKVCGGGPCAEQYEYEKTLSSSDSIVRESESSTLSFQHVTAAVN